MLDDISEDPDDPLLKHQEKREKEAYEKEK